MRAIKRVRSRLQRCVLAIRRSLPQERGFSLVLAISIVATLTIVTVGVASVVTSNERSASHSADTTRAFFNAEFGLGVGESYISSADPSNSASAMSHSGSGLISGNTTTKPSTYSYTATKTVPADANAYWTIDATGVRGYVTRKLRLTVNAKMIGAEGPPTTTTTQTVSSIWGWGVFVGSGGTQSSTSGCNAPLSLGGGAVIKTSVFVNGDVCLEGGASIVQDTTKNPNGTSVYVGKKFYSLNNAAIGTSSKKVTLADIVGGCINATKTPNTVTCSTGANSNVWATTYSTIAQPGVAFPTIDADGWYQNAAPGPNHPCGTNFKPASGGKFDNNTTRDASDPSAYNPGIDIILPSYNGQAYTCTSSYTDADGVVHSGTLSWNNSTSPGTLTVDGTIFIDGNLNFTGDDQAQYQGHGTIYVDGTVTFNNGATLCAVWVSSSNCGSTWDPANKSLAIVAINQKGTNPTCSPNTSASFCMLGNGKFQGAAIAKGPVYENNSGYVIGPIMTDSKATLAGGVVFPPFTETGCTLDGLNICIPGAPGVTTTTTTEEPTEHFDGWDITGNTSWQEIK